MSDSRRFFELGDGRVFVGQEHRLANRRGWVSLKRLARADLPPGAPRWAVSTYPHEKGYVLILVGRDHPFANKGGKVLLHRLVMSTHLQRRLHSAEHVHHVNEIKADLSIRNIEVLEDACHGRYHYGQRTSCGPHVCKACAGSGCAACRGGVCDQRSQRLAV